MALCCFRNLTHSSLPALVLTASMLTASTESSSVRPCANTTAFSLRLCLTPALDNQNPARVGTLMCVGISRRTQLTCTPFGAMTRRPSIRPRLNCCSASAIKHHVFPVPCSIPKAYRVGFCDSLFNASS